MSRYVPVLTEVVVRAWGLDDPRVLTHLRAENQPGRTFRTKAIGKRAKSAGWPAMPTSEEARKATAAAVVRLERINWQWTTDRHHYLFGLSAYESRSRRGQVTVPVDDDGSHPASIFDE